MIPENVAHDTKWHTMASITCIIVIFSCELYKLCSNNVMLAQYIKPINGSYTKYNSELGHIRVSSDARIDNTRAFIMRNARSA